MTQPPCHPDGAEFREDNIYQPAIQTAERGNNCKILPGPCQLDLCPSSKTQDYFTSARKKSSASSSRYSNVPQKSFLLLLRGIHFKNVNTLLQNTLGLATSHSHFSVNLIKSIVFFEKDR